MKSVLENFPGIQPQPTLGQLVKHTQRTPKRWGRSDATPQTFGSSNKGDVGLMVDFLMVWWFDGKKNMDSSRCFFDLEVMESMFYFWIPKKTEELSFVALFSDQSYRDEFPREFVLLEGKWCFCLYPKDWEVQKFDLTIWGSLRLFFWEKKPNLGLLISFNPNLDVLISFSKMFKHESHLIKFDHKKD